MAGYIGSKAVLLSTTAAIVTGDMTVDTNTLKVDSTNNRVGLGTASPTAQLHIVGDDTSNQVIIENTATSASSAPDLMLLRTSTSSAADNDVIGRIDFAGLNDANEQIHYFTISARIDDASDGTENGMLRLQHIKDGSYVEPVVIDGSGNVGIGTDTPSRQLTVQNTIANSGGVIGLTSSDSSTSGTCGIIHFGNSTDSSLASINGIADGATDAGAIVFKTEKTGASIEERMRIGSSGNFVLGTTNDSQAAGVGVKLLAAGRVFSVTDSGSGECFSNYQTGSSSGYKFYVANSGTIFSTSTSISSISDERLKENIKDLDKGLTDILKLKPRTFDWKEGEGSGEKNVSGFIAQECEEAGFDEFVGSFKHDTLSDAKSFGYGGLVPSLVKAVQELSAKNDALEARITALEAK